MEDEINKNLKFVHTKRFGWIKKSVFTFSDRFTIFRIWCGVITRKQKRINNNLNIVLSDIEKSKRQEKDVLFNSEIENELEKLQNQSDDLDYQMDMLAKKSTTLHGEIQVLKTKEKQINDNIDKVEKLEGDHQAYQFY